MKIKTGVTRTAVAAGEEDVKNKATRNEGTLIVANGLGGRES
jgi:hypothetical protein